MQLVLSNNRIIAHGENFLSLGGVVINTETGARYDNATIAECEGCPSDIDTVGYEYHAGVFVPCAPYGEGNKNGYFMEVCETCATPRSSGIPIKNGLGRENLSIFPLIWENASPRSSFAEQTIDVDITAYVGFIVVVDDGGLTYGGVEQGIILSAHVLSSATVQTIDEDIDTTRTLTVTTDGIEVREASGHKNGKLVPVKIYGVKL